MSAAVITVKNNAKGMFDRLVQNAHRVPAEVERSARKTLSGISGIPVDTGRLAASPRIVARGNEAEIVSDVEYAHYVFGGTEYMDAQPPHISYDSEQFARDLSVEIFRG